MGFFQVAILGKPGFGAPVFNADQCDFFPASLQFYMFIHQQTPAQFPMDFLQSFQVGSFISLTVPMYIIAVIVIAQGRKHAHRGFQAVKDIHIIFHRLGQVISNLSSNAMQYGLPVIKAA